MTTSRPPAAQGKLVHLVHDARGRGTSGGALTVVAAVLAAVLFLPAGAAAQQARYDFGQTLSPAYEGWELNDDGSFNLVFGYMNRNWEQAPYVPVGPDNRFEPGDPDRGQPTYFLPAAEPLRLPRARAGRISALRNWSGPLR